MAVSKNLFCDLVCQNKGFTKLIQKGEIKFSFFLVKNIFPEKYIERNKSNYKYFGET